MADDRSAHIEAERKRVREAMIALRASGEECGFCDDGMIRDHPANRESDWCPYCDGTGYVLDPWSGRG